MKVVFYQIQGYNYLEPGLFIYHLTYNGMMTNTF